MEAGDVIAGRFEIERRAAAGGMGEVYRARDLVTGAAVALKTIRGARADGEERQHERFEREAELLADLTHPAIVRYVAYGLGEREDERWLAMEWLEGESLAARLYRGPLGVEESISLARRVASALAALHARRIVHRDVKPSNLILCGDEVEGVKLVDFGVARVGRARRELTTVRAMVGTPGYMAPEQARGEADVDARADVFALGAVLFECLTGRELFVGENRLAVLLKSVLEEAPRARDLAPEVPEALDDLVASMVDKDRDRRPADAARVRDALDAFLSEPAVPSVASGALDAGAGLGRVALAPGALGAGAGLGRGGPAPVRAIPGTLALRAAPTDALTGAERRVVSLVVARRLTTDDDTDETIPAGLHGPYIRRIRAVAEQHGGDITLLADGSVVVALASGAAASDLAAQAARCAVALGAILDGAAIAVVSGRAVLRGELPVGELIDRAVALLAARSSPGVDLDDVTTRLVRGRFDIARDEGGLRLSGGSAALGGARDEAGMRLSGGSVALGGARTLLGRPTPCVGRDGELAAIEAAFEACAEASASRAVVITAAAGIGKSRLGYEVMRRLRARFGATIWIGRGDPMSAGSAFAVLAQALRGALGVQEGAPIEARREAVRARVAARVPESEAPRVAEFLAELVGAPFPDEASERLRSARQDTRLMGDQMRRAVIELVRASCAGGPVVLVLEDLHHGDLPTVSFVAAALAATHDLPLFVLALGRPEVRTTFPRLWEAEAPVVIDLPALPPEAGARLASLLLGSASEEALARIVERAEGNAFYLEELIRATAEGRDGALPETVLAMAQARVEALAPDLRRTLRAASVLGETFTAGGIAALRGGVDRAAVDGWIDDLVRAEVLTRRAESGDLAFRHALLREVAYGMLTEEDRARGHRLAGAFLEAAGSRDAATLAEHFERGGDRARALSWYRRAAEEALDGNDLGAAVAGAERGLLCSPEAADACALHLLVAEARLWRGELAAAMASGEAALSAAPRGTALFYRAAGQLALVASRLARVDRVAAVAELLADAPSRLDAANARALALNQAIMGFFVAGHYDEADALIGVLTNAMTAYAITDPAVVARTSYSLARQAHVRGDLGEMLARRREAADAARRVDDRKMICTFGLSIGDALLHLGAYPEAERELRVVVPQAAALGLASMGTAATLNLGVALAGQGRREEAHARLEEAAAEFVEQGDQACEATARVYASLILTAAGELDRGEGEARAALGLEADPPMRAYASAALAMALLARGHGEEALAAAGEGHALLASLGSVEEGESQIRLAWAEALHAAGDPRAVGAIREARGRLLWRAGRIRDKALQRSFLERVPENARTLALAREWAGE